jgi:ABC-type transporter Mla maintaining outer membrane lipid asymmetry ATPase subunit MlaF
MDECIGLRDIMVSVGGNDILRRVSVSFPEGMSTVIMGPSGSGKSTLLKVAAGLIPPDEGTVLLRGEDFFLLSERKVRELRRTNGFVFQDGALWENKTIFENLALPLQVHRPDMRPANTQKRVARMLERTGMEECALKRPAQLSVGERKIISFLRALVAEPTIVFLDEPTLSIDHAMAERLVQMIRDLKARGCTIIAVTHDPRLTSTLADFLVVLAGGEVLETGPFDSVKRTMNPRARAILSQVLGEIAAYDTDLLALLQTGAEEDGLGGTGGPGANGAN